jgi:hypothetical protein
VTMPGLFDGATYDEERDRERLARQLAHVRSIMLDGQWHTLPELASGTSWLTTSMSARLRDLRKKRFGGWIVHREYIDNGLWRYRLHHSYTSCSYVDTHGAVCPRGRGN